MRFDPWREGLDQYGAYNGTTLTVPKSLSDWRGYDRLSFDVVTTDNGDGCWMHAGPDGVPLATIRLENFRDGLEDLWYAKLYEKKFGRKPEVPSSLIRPLRRIFWYNTT